VGERVLAESPEDLDELLGFLVARVEREGLVDGLLGFLVVVGDEVIESRRDQGLDLGLARFDARLDQQALNSQMRRLKGCRLLQQR